MKSKVLAFLKDGSGVPEERYNEAMALLQKSEGKSVAQVNSYYRSGFTETNLKNICYDLQQLHGIPDVEIASGSKKSKVQSTKSENGLSMALIKAIESASEEFKIAVLIFERHPDLWNAELASLQPYYNAVVAFGETNADLIENDSINLSEEKYKKLFVAAIGDIQLTDEIKIVLKGAIELVNSVPDVTKNGTDIPKNDTDVSNIETIETVTPLVEEIKKADDAVKGGLKLRERFAFLGEADCPDKLKILVADMLSAWDAFKRNHELLFHVTEGEESKEMPNEVIFELAKETIEAFQLNHAIWDELEFYNEHKEVLGNHPIFADDQLKEKVAAMSDVDLVNRQKNVRSYISKENKKLKSAKDEAATTKIKKKIQELNQELNLLDERIGAKK
tara:strand:- start:940 stop:2112 length:1173 start_codon:yes stop_codon:yes gene_type:complete